MKKNLFIAILVFVSFFSNAQEEELEFRHSVGVMISHATVLTEARIEGQQRLFWVPTWGFLYDFEVTQRFALGIHADLFLQQFTIREEDGEVITRDYPIAIALVGEYNLFDQLWLIAGGGIELERDQNLGIITVGVEYAIPFSSYWKLTPSLSYDAKINGYQNWVLGLAIARRF